MRPARSALDLVHDAPELVDELRAVHGLHGPTQRHDERGDVPRGVRPLAEHAGEVGRLPRLEHLARPERRRRRGADGDLDDLVAEEPLRLDPRHRVPADPIREPPGDGEIHPHLAARRARQAHVAHAPDLHAREPDRRALGEAAHLREVGVDRVARLEQARAGAERVDHAEEDGQRQEHEHAHPELLRQLPSFVVHRLASPPAAARTPTFIGSSRLSGQEGLHPCVV